MAPLEIIQKLHPGELAIDGKRLSCRPCDAGAAAGKEVGTPQEQPAVFTDRHRDACEESKRRAKSRKNVVPSNLSGRLRAASSLPRGAPLSLRLPHLAEGAASGT